MAKRTATFRQWVWTDPIYDVSVVLTRGSRTEWNNWLEQSFGRDWRQDEHPCRATTLFVSVDQGTALTLWVSPACDTADADWLGVLAHEAFHAACAVLQKRGVEFNAGSEEAFSYYTGWVFREMLTRLRKK